MLNAGRARVERERIRDAFTSPDDLARRVVLAIRNWEHAQDGAAPAPVAGESDQQRREYLEALAREHAHIPLAGFETNPAARRRCRHPPTCNVTSCGERYGRSPSCR